MSKGFGILQKAILRSLYKRTGTEKGNSVSLSSIKEDIIGYRPKLYEKDDQTPYFDNLSHSIKILIDRGLLEGGSQIQDFKFIGGYRKILRLTKKGMQKAKELRVKK
ncbi:MAG: hypothetical protein GH144_03975 [Clostridia bacterium]|jgi:hypothetical protein|nr:hypothetical protein [Clostridia bacterium]